MADDREALIDPTVELADVEELLAEYGDALTWMEGLTRLSPHSRWRTYEGLITNIVDRVKRGRGDVAIVDEAEARNAYYEVAQFRTIYRQFKGSGHSAIGKKLAFVAKGNVKYTDEEEDTRSRDTAFELFLAAVLQEAGLRVSLGDDTARLEDLRIFADDFDLFVECKRPHSEKAVRPCADKAFKQLEKRLATTERPSFGAVAFAVDRVMNPTSAFIQAKHSQFIPEALTSRTSAFIRAHTEYWATKRPKGVILAFAQLCGSAYVGEVPFGIFSSVVTLERLPILLTEDGRANLRAMDHVFDALAVDEV